MRFYLGTYFWLSNFVESRAIGCWLPFCFLGFLIEITRVKKSKLKYAKPKKPENIIIPGALVIHFKYRAQPNHIQQSNKLQSFQQHN